MSCSPARLAANQKNAQKSTGPTTEAGKARSRLNAVRHGLAGSGDLLLDGDDLELIARRTAAFGRELAAPGELGLLLAHRAAVLSVRMERAADRDLQHAAASARAGRDAFDADRAAIIAECGAELEVAVAPGPILADLAATPDGVAYLRDAWEDLRAAVAEGDVPARDRAALWLGCDHAAGDLLGRIDAERARLAAVADSPALAAATLELRRARHEAGVLARFDPSPEATLARRYEAAAERGLYRALKAIKDLRQGMTTEAAQVLPHLPAFTPPPPPTPPASPPAPPTLGSFRPGECTPSASPLPVAAGRPRPGIGPLKIPRIGSDPRPTSPNRR